MPLGWPSLVLAVAALGCGGAASPAPPADGVGGNPPNGPCVIAVDDQTSITVDGWCFHGPGLVSLDDQAVIAVAGSNPFRLVRVDRATGARTVLNGGDDDPSVYGPVVDGGDEIFYGCLATAGGFCPSPPGFFAVPRTGGAVRRVVDREPLTDADLALGYPALAVDATSIYWLDSSLWRAPRAGGGTPERLGPGATRSGSLAVDGAALLVALAPEDVIERVPLDGSAPCVVTTAASPAELLVAGDRIYWTEYPTPGGDCTASGSIKQWDGSATTTIADDVAGLGDLAVVGDTMLWTAAGRFCNQARAIGTVDELRRGFRAPLALATGQLGAGSVLGDGSEVFWTVSSGWDGGGAILHAPLR